MVLYWILLPIVWVIWHVLWRIRVVGSENLIRGRGFVIAPNHISDLDPVFVAISVFTFHRMCILAKEELFHNWFIGWFLRNMGAVPIARGKGDTNTVGHVTEQVSAGRGLLIFPEGTRTKDGKIGVIKSGAFVVAGQAGVDMIPCRIIYDTKDGRQHLFCRVRVCFGEPIPAADLKIQDPRHSMSQLRTLKNRLRDCWEDLYEQNKF